MDSASGEVSVEEVLRRLQAVPNPRDVFAVSLDTPFSKYYGSNYSAPVSEFPEIYKLISKRKKQIADIDTIMQHLEIILEQFSDQRERMISSMRMHEGFTSCIRRLPSEILQVIFVHCLPPEMRKQPDMRAAPLLLTGICRRWREVALNTPRLWCSLVVNRSEQLPYYSGWLEKAQSYPLSLHINMPFQDRGSVLKFLQPYTSRLTNLAFCTNFWVAGLPSLFSNLPILECLWLMGDMGDMLDEHKISITQFQPRLRTLAISFPVLHINTLSAFNPGWTNLSYLAVLLGDEQLDVADPIFLTLLQTCPNLEHLVLSPVPVFLHHDSAPFTHSKLRVLDIADVQWNVSVLRTLTLPNLCHLHVHDTLALNPEALAIDDTTFPGYSLLKEQQNRALTIKFAFYSVCAGNYLFRSLNPGWTTLKRIKMDFSAYEGIFFHALKLGLNLEEFVIPSIDIDPTYDDVDDEDSEAFQISHSPIVHSKLHSLNIGIRSGPFAKILDRLTFPALHHLNLSLPDDHEWPHRNFKAFISRSRCPLKTIRIKVPGSRMTIEQFEEISALIPTLTCIELYDMASED